MATRVTIYRRCRTLLVWLVFVTFIALSAAIPHLAYAAGSSYTFSYNGRLIDPSGRPVEGPVTLSIAFYHMATGGSPTLTVTDGLAAVPLQEGVFQISLVLSGSDFHAAFPSVSQAVYIEITDLTNRADAPYDRQLVAIMPYAAKVPVDGSTLEFNSQGELTLKSSAAGGQTAISAINAASSGTIAAARLPALGGDLSGNLDAATVGKLRGRPIAATAPNNDEYLKWNGTSWVPSALAGTSGGTVTSVTMGQGLSGGPITASGTIDLRLNASGGLSKTLGAGSNELGIAAGGLTPAMLSNTGCNTDGKVLKVSAGVWACGDDVGLASGAIVNADIAAGAAIADTKLAQITTANKVADSALSSNVTKLGSDIDLSSAEVTSTLPIGKGGTGATTLTGIAIGNGTSAMTAVAGTSSQYLRRNAANNAYEFASLGDAAAKNTGTSAGEVAAGNHSHANAVAGVSAGFMSAADKTALDGLSSGAVMDADFASNGLLRRTGAGTYDTVTDSTSNWNTAYTDRFTWDGSALANSGTQATARTSLGLGTMATQAANNVSITGGTISGVAMSLTGISDGADATAITIDSSERVGIGTGTPSVRLHAATNDAVTNTVTDILQLNHSSSGTPAASFGSGLLFTGESTTTDSRDMARVQSIWSTATDASRASKLQFQTLTGAGALTTQMTIDGAGNVGIGTSDPATKVQVEDASGDATYLSLKQSGTGGRFYYLGSTGNSNGQGGGKFVIWDNTASANRLTIDGTGKVGIDTTSPQTTLHLTSTQPSTATHPYRNGILVEAEGTNVGGRVGARTAGTAETPVFMGIRSRGTLAAPTAVQTGDALGNVATLGYDGSAFNNATFILGSASENWTSSAHGSNLQFQTVTNGTTTLATRMTILDSGNVGVNTTSPSSTLHVNGSFGQSFRAITSSYSLTATDAIVVATPTAAMTITMPTAVGIAGRQYILKNNTSHVVTIDPAAASGQTFDGKANYYLGSQYQTVTLVSDGANWAVIGTVGWARVNTGASSVSCPPGMYASGGGAWPMQSWTTYAIAFQGGANANAIDAGQNGYNVAATAFCIPIP